MQLLFINLLCTWNHNFLEMLNLWILNRLVIPNLSFDLSRRAVHFQISLVHFQIWYDLPNLNFLTTKTLTKRLPFLSSELEKSVKNYIIFNVMLGHYIKYFIVATRKEISFTLIKTNLYAIPLRCHILIRIA